MISNTHSPRLVLILRDQEMGARSAARLRDLPWAVDLTPVVCPVLRFSDLGPDVPDHDGVIFTSPRGVDAWRRMSGATTRPVWAVGPATADAALRCGFEAVRSSDGDSAALAAAMAACPQTRELRWLHLSGRDVAGDLIGALRAMKITADRRVVYAADPIEAPPSETAALFAKAVAALVYSPRGGRVFAGWMSAKGLTPPPVAAISLKALAASGLTGRAAADPNEDSLFDALRALIANS